MPETVEPKPISSYHILTWREALSGALLGLIPVAVVACFLSFSWFAVIVDDGVTGVQPVLGYSLDTLMQGKLPLWSDAISCGTPSLGLPGMGSLYPVYFAARGVALLSGIPHCELAVTYFIHIWFAGFAAWLYLRYCRVAKPWAALSSISFAMSGTILGLGTCWATYTSFIPFVPVGFMVVEALINGERKWHWPVLGGLSGGLVCLQGDPTLLIKYHILVILYLIFRLKWNMWRPVLLRGSVALVLTLMIGSGQMLASWRVSNASERIKEGGWKYEDTASNSCRLEFFRGSVFPFAEFDWSENWQWSRHGNDAWAPTFSGASLFVGPLMPLALLLTLLFFFQKGEHRAMLLLLVLYALLSLGDSFPADRMLHHLPILKQFRWPVRWTFEYCAVGALLVGHGLQLLDIYRDFKRVSAAMALFGCWLLIELAQADVLPAGWQQRVPVIAASWGLMAAAFTWSWFFCSRRLLILTATVFTLSGLTVAIPMSQRMKRDDLRHLVTGDFALETGKHDRILLLANRHEQRRETCPIAYDLSHRYGLRRVLGYTVGARDQLSWMAGINYAGEVVNRNDAIAAFLHGNLLRALRVGLVLVAADNQLANRACGNHPDLTLEETTYGMNVYRHTGFRQPAFLVSKLVKSSEVGPAVRMGTVELDKTAIAEDSYRGPTAFSAEGTVEQFSENRGSISMNVTADKAAYLVITTTIFHGWQATIDGKDAPIHRTNHSFMGIAIPPGTHRVKLEFNPPLLKLLLWLGAITFVVSVLLLIRAISGTAQSPAPPQTA